MDAILATTQPTSSCFLGLLMLLFAIVMLIIGIFGRFFINKH